MSEPVSAFPYFPNFQIDKYLQKFGIEYVVHDARSHREYALNCPMCERNGEPTPDTQQKLWLNETTGFFICYRCNWKGGLQKLIQAFSKCSYDEALQVLRGEPLSPLSSLNLQLVTDRVIRYEDEYGGLRPIDLPYGFESIEGPHDYLEERDIPWQYARDHDWGFATVGYCANRIIVPFYMENWLVFWQARATWNLSDDEKKVLNPKGISVRNILFNYDEAKEFETIILVEGFVDAVKAGPNAVATNGKRLHPEQVEWLRKTKAKKIVIAWDSDAWEPSGRSPILKAAGLLKIFFDVYAVKMPEKMDCGSFPFRSPELQDILKKTIQL